jgi:hypothetical protein
MTNDIQRFITHWQKSGAAERASYQPFLFELCDVPNAPRPDPTTPDEAGNACFFEAEGGDFTLVSMNNTWHLR